MEKDEPLTPAGRLFVQPEMEQIINCAISTKHQLDIEAVKAEVRGSIMLQHPRFCSLMVRDSRGREHWRRTEVDVDRHFVVFPGRLADDPEVSDEDAVNDYLADLSVSTPLDHDKPLWEIHLLMAHNCVVFRVHHALGDGISLMSMLLSCCRRADDPTQVPSIKGVGTSSSGGGQRRRWKLWKALKGVWLTFVFVLEFVLRGLWWKDRKTAVSGRAGVELWPRKLATARFKIADMKIIKRAIPSTVGDEHAGI